MAIHAKEVEGKIDKIKLRVSVRIEEEGKTTVGQVADTDTYSYTPANAYLEVH